MKRGLVLMFAWLGMLGISPAVAAAKVITATLSGTACPGAGCLNIDTDGAGTLGVQVTGTFSGTLTFTQTIDKLTFASWSVLPNGSTVGVTTTTGSGLWFGVVAGASQVRVAFTSYTSGTAVVSTVPAQAKFQDPGGTLTAHNLLSTSHGDTVAASPPTRGDLIMANSAAKWARVALGASSAFLRSDGSDAGWSTLTLPNSSGAGDLLYASAANTTANLADAAVGNALISGGVGVAPSYGKIDLTTHISGTLAVGNGGTGLTAGTSGGVLGFTGTTTLASSALLTAHGVMLGGGVAATPTALTLLGTAGQVLTSNGAGADPSWQAAASGGIAPVYTAKTDTYGAAANDFVVATSGTFTVTLPTTASNLNKAIWVVNAGSGIITVTRTGSDIIGNQAETSQTLNPGDSMSFLSNGLSPGTWYIW